MKKVISTVPPEILDILRYCRTEGKILFLPNGTLDRKTYEVVNKVLTNIGGKWNRKAKGHVFETGDPTELLRAVLDSGESVNIKKPSPYRFTRSISAGGV